jgi:hypothetical protein
MRFNIMFASILAATMNAVSADSTKKPSQGSPAISDATKNRTLVHITDSYLFKAKMEDFQRARNHTLVTLNDSGVSSDPQSQLDWFSDGCSSSPDQPFHFDFLAACQRHDFGYRNYHRQGRFTEPHRENIDNNLHRDLRDVCAGVKSRAGTKRKFCFKVAKLYWKAVREFGSGHLMVRVAEERECGPSVGDHECKIGG